MQDKQKPNWQLVQETSRSSMDENSYSEYRELLIALAINYKGSVLILYTAGEKLLLRKYQRLVGILYGVVATLVVISIGISVDAYSFLCSGSIVVASLMAIGGALPIFIAWKESTNRILRPLKVSAEDESYLQFAKVYGLINFASRVSWHESSGSKLGQTIPEFLQAIESSLVDEAHNVLYMVSNQNDVGEIASRKIIDDVIDTVYNLRIIPIKQEGRADEAKAWKKRLFEKAQQTTPRKI